MLIKLMQYFLSFCRRSVAKAKAMTKTAIFYLAITVFNSSLWFSRSFTSEKSSKLCLLTMLK